MRNTRKSNTFMGLIWSFTELISQQGILLVVHIVLARLLLPEHFGLIGMVTIFIAISNLLVQSGMDQALIRETDPSQVDYSTVFYFNLVISIIIYIIIYLSSPFIASFFNQSDLIGILRILALGIIINSLVVIQRVFLIRAMNFRVQSIISIIAGIISGIIAIILAYIGIGVWSLIIQIITMQSLQALLYIYFNRWVPSFKFSINSFKTYFNFGYKLVLSGLIDTIYNNLYFVIIGKLHSPTQLGYYTNASKLKDAAAQSVTQAIQKVTYPSLSKIKDESQELTSSYRKIIKTSAFVLFPFMLGLFATAPNFIPLILGNKWIPSILYFQLLCLAAMLYPIHAINLNILKVKGRTDLFLKLEIIKKFILTILLVLSILFDGGIVGLIIAAIINSFISMFINMYFSGREINYTYKQQLKDIGPIFLISGIMGVMVHIINDLVTDSYVFNLLIQILIGILIYVTLSKIFKIREFIDINNYIKKIVYK